MTSSFHLACLRQTPPPAGPGAVIFTLRRPLALRGPSPDEITVMVEGQVLYSETAACVRDALARHLHGPLDRSGFRQGVATLLGLGNLGFDPAFTAGVEHAVDVYSGVIAGVRLVYGNSAKTETLGDGLFNRMGHGLAFALASQEV